MQNDELHETGDRWKLDVLIPKRDRTVERSQYETHTLGVHSLDVQREASKPVLKTDYTIDPSLRHHTPIHSGMETGVEAQRRLRLFFTGEQPRPDDRLL